MTGEKPPEAPLWHSLIKPGFLEETMMAEVMKRSERLASWDLRAAKNQAKTKLYDDFRQRAEELDYDDKTFDEKWAEAEKQFPGDEFWEKRRTEFFMKHAQAMTARMTRAFVKAMLGFWEVPEEPKPEAAPPPPPEDDG